MTHSCSKDVLMRNRPLDMVQHAAVKCARPVLRTSIVPNVTALIACTACESRHICFLPVYPCYTRISTLHGGSAGAAAEELHFEFSDAVRQELRFLGCECVSSCTRPGCR